MFLSSLGSNPLRDSYICDWGFLDVVSGPFLGLVVCGVVLGLGYVGTEAHGLTPVSFNLEKWPFLFIFSFH